MAVVVANIPPVVDLDQNTPGTASTASYTEGQPLTVIAPAGTVVDPDSTNFDQGVLTVTIESGTDLDRLGIASGGSIFADENSVYYDFGRRDQNGDRIGPELIGYWYGGTGASNPLTVTFNSAATRPAVEALLRAIGYYNLSSSPGTARTVDFTLSDGDGGTSPPAVAAITINQVDQPAVANDDHVTTDEATPYNGNLFADTGDGPDYDPDGTTIQVTSVNGSSDNLNKTIQLSSGATLRVNSDGSFTYNPNGAFNSLTSPSTGESGAVNTQANDSFSYTVTGGDGAVATVVVTGLASSQDVLAGDEDDNTITGTPGNDRFMVQQGGNDNVSGLGGNDSFYFGAAFNSFDTVNGGAGYDTLVLQGSYVGASKLTLSNVSNLEALSFINGSRTDFGDTGNQRYDYDITTVDATVAPGVQFKVNGSNLLAGEDLTFNGSAEQDGTFLIYGGFGTDTLKGGAGNDSFVFFGGRFQTGDTVNGNGGYDGLFLRGNYTINFTDQAWGTPFTNLENLTLMSATDNRFGRGLDTEFDYSITFADALLATGSTMTVNGGGLQANETMIFNGANEEGGNFRIFGGAAADTLTGGGGSDQIYGGLGGDLLTGNGGADIFRYHKVAESLAGDGTYDTIQGFTHGVDKIDLSRIDANPSTPENDAFIFGGEVSAPPSTPNWLSVVHGRGDQWIVSADTTGDGNVDFYLVVNMQPGEQLTASDFIL